MQVKAHTEYRLTGSSRARSGFVPLATSADLFNESRGKVLEGREAGEAGKEGREVGGGAGVAGKRR